MEAVLPFFGQRAMPRTHANGLKDAYFLEPKGWTAWVRLQFQNTHGKNVMEHTSTARIKGRTDQGRDERPAALTRGTSHPADCIKLFLHNSKTG
jgi:hypothetical protein